MIRYIRNHRIVRRKLMSKIVCLYTRISTSNLGQDIDRQIYELQNVCKNNEWDIVEEYTEVGESGSKKDRPELTRLLKDARQHKFQMVVCLELSRIARSTKHLLDLVGELRNRKIHL